MFDALFDPNIVIEKQSGKRLSGLVDILKYNPPPDRLLTLKLQRMVLVFNVKNMVSVVDNSLYYRIFSLLMVNYHFSPRMDIFLPCVIRAHFTWCVMCSEKSRTILPGLIRTIDNHNSVENENEAKFTLIELYHQKDQFVLITVSYIQATFSFSTSAKRAALNSFP